MSPRRAIESKPVAVMGLDMSLRGPAVVVLPARWAPGDWKTVKSVRLTLEGELEGMARTEAIVARIFERVEVYDVKACFIENYAFSFSANAITNIAELVGAVKYMIWCGQKLYVRPVVASSARKTLFGPLPRMSRKEIKKYVEIELGKMGATFETEDERDAFVVANRGLYDLGLPCLAHG